MNQGETKDSALVPSSVGSTLPAVAQISVKELLESFLSGRSPATMEAYRADIKDLATFLSVPSIDAAAEAVVRAGHGGANLLAMRFKSYLIERGLGASSVNRKLAALRSLVTLANTLGMVDWSVQVPNLRVEKPNVTGVGLRAVRNLIAVAGNEHGIKGVRDRAIIRVFFDLALRRAEVCSLDLGDVDLANQRVAVKRKGHHDNTMLTLPEPTCQALQEWVERRGEEPGPLFHTLDHRLLNQRQRLTTCGVYHIVRELGRKAGFRWNQTKDNTSRKALDNLTSRQALLPPSSSLPDLPGRFFSGEAPGPTRTPWSPKVRVGTPKGLEGGFPLAHPSEVRRRASWMGPNVYVPLAATPLSR